MPPHAVPVTLTASERKILKLRARGAMTPYRDRERAQIVLAAARGHPNRPIAAFTDRYNQTAKPFSWKYTATDLHDLMERISRHEQQNPQREPLPQAA